MLGHCTTECAVSDLADKIGMVLEDPEAQLFTTTVRNEVAFGAENLQVDPDEIIRRINWALDIVGLSEYIDREPTALSGGQKQRLAIATNLVMLPSVLVLDEPTSQLDPVGTRDVFNVIRELKEKEDMIIIEATLYVERESQKGIVIGAKGTMLKEIGSLARTDLEKLLGSKVYLTLWVKARKDWRDSEGFLKQLGYRKE
ncbi:GTPase Era [bioreactor metagenome]|uniref:GTPase Era n=1 Tax=bioreactor metagenome TaxID=1076179 RepID=A0A645CKT6_9ZZZZ